MKKYSVKITLSDQRTIVSKLYANTDGEAVSRVSSNAEFGKFAGTSTVKNIEVEEIPADPNPFTPSDFDFFIDTLKPSGWYRVIDRRTGCIVSFLEGQFNRTATVVQPPEPPEGATDDQATQYAAEAMRRIGDYVAAYHYNTATRGHIPYKQLLGMQYRTIRESKGLSLNELATILQLPDTKPIERIESGWIMENRFSRMEQIAEALGCTLQLIPDTLHEFTTQQ